MKRLLSVKFLMFNVVFFCMLQFVHYQVFAQPVSSADLINDAKEYDGKIVTFEGEVIGDVMMRRDFAWVNLNDGNNAIGIWMPKDLTLQIEYTGSYKSIGDCLEVSGVFHRACPEHGGDLDIHAMSIRKTASGRIVKENVSQNKKNHVFILLGVLGLVWILTLLKHK